MRLLRWVAVLAAMAMGGLLVGCGGGGTPAPTPTTATPAPVSVRVQAIGGYAAQNADGLVALRVATNGPHAASATVVLTFDVPSGKKLAVRYEPAQSGTMDTARWPALKLASSPGPKPGLDTLTGSYAVPLHGGDMWRFVLQPQYGPSSGSETFPVHASLVADGRTLASGSAAARLDALVVTADDVPPTGGTLHRDGAWTEGVFTVSNASTRNLAPVYAGVRIRGCERLDVVNCAGPDLLDDFLVQTFDGHRWVSPSSSNGTSRRVLSTSLEPGAATKVRIRFTPTAALATGVDRVEVRLASAGTMSGQKLGVIADDSQYYDVNQGLAARP